MNPLVYLVAWVTFCAVTTFVAFSQAPWLGAVTILAWWLGWGAWRDR
jgi:hypothetical protein